MSRARLFFSKYGLDVLIVIAAVESAISTARRDDPGHPTGPLLLFEVLAVSAIVLTLLARRRFPFGAPAVTWLWSAALSFVDGLLIVDKAGLFLAGMGAALLLGNLPGDRQARVGLAIVLGGAAIVIYNDPNHVRGDVIFTPVLFAIGWLVGYALRERTEQTKAAEERATRAEREREAAARVAVAEERGRIARELHDVVAHAVSVMVLQVGAVRHRMPETDTEDRETLTNVEQAGRTALAEMRRLLNAMRHDDDELELLPHPGLGNLDALVDDVRAAGLPVRLQISGEPVALPPGLDLSAYRILQEGLTNALKHARASQAEVEVQYTATELRLEVRDDGPGGPSTDAGVGHGLVGIRERVRIFGGGMSAGTSRAGGFVLRAQLPLDHGAR
ncbi:sensor histidine kinase [Kribbella sp. NBC_01484]|uniref:sensor histidine kinase n=1 Tax=Kribbella sp. NBC_01484 TaxID=2903579 RepID=UPI002E32181D|nr:sensor histidine kinase [Kribbella sp. NBC_01484]